MLNYKLIEKVNPRDLASPRKYFAVPKHNNNIGFRELVKNISKLSTVNPPDIMAVLETLIDVIPESLKQGNTVHLGDLGSFFVTLQSTGKEDPLEFTTSDITGIRIKFRPGKVLKKEISQADFKKDE